MGQIYKLQNQGTVLTPRLKAATQIPVASPRRHPISRSAHSGGAPSLRTSGERPSSDPPWSEGRRFGSLRSRCNRISLIPLFFPDDGVLTRTADAEDGPSTSRPESDTVGADRNRAFWSSIWISAPDIAADDQGEESYTSIASDLPGLGDLLPRGSKEVHGIFSARWLFLIKVVVAYVGVSLTSPNFLPFVLLDRVCLCAFVNRHVWMRIKWYAGIAGAYYTRSKLIIIYNLSYLIT